MGVEEVRWDREGTVRAVNYNFFYGKGNEWFNIIVLNVHAPSEEKSDDSKDSFYKELEQVFYHFRKYHMKILLGDFNEKVGRENILKPTSGYASLH